MSCSSISHVLSAVKSENEARPSIIGFVAPSQFRLLTQRLNTFRCFSSRNHTYFLTVPSQRATAASGAEDRLSWAGGPLIIPPAASSASASSSDTNQQHVRPKPFTPTEDLHPYRRSQIHRFMFVKGSANFLKQLLCSFYQTGGSSEEMMDLLGTIFSGELIHI